MKITRITHATVFIVLVTLILSGCSGLPPSRFNRTIIKDDQTLPVPGPDAAIVVFLNSGSVSDTVYDVTLQDPKLVGLVKASTKFTYEVPKGEHYFLTASGNRFMAANVTGGKTYYVLIEGTTLSAALGLGMAVVGPSPWGPDSFGQPIPVRNGAEGIYQYSQKYIQDKLRDDELIEVTVAAREFYSNEFWTSNVKERRNRDLPKFKNIPKTDLLKVTLNSEDGISTNNHSIQSAQIIQGDKSVSFSYSEELEALKSLRDDGIFTEEEFQKQKAKLLEKE